jgi:hypothetical protein
MSACSLLRYKTCLLASLRFFPYYLLSYLKSENGQVKSVWFFSPLLSPYLYTQPGGNMSACTSSRKVHIHKENILDGLIMSSLFRPSECEGIQETH